LLYELHLALPELQRKGIMMKKIKSLCALTAVAAAALFAPVAKADYVLTFQGVTFTIGVIDSNSLSLEIVNAASTTDADWAAATNFGAFSLKDLGLDFSAAGGATATATYFGIPNVSVNGVRDDLNAATINAGADCVAQTNGEKGTVCFDFAPDLSLLDDMKFQIDFNKDFTIDSLVGPHLKVAFVDADGGKVGSLLSQNLPLSSSSSSSSTSSGDISTSSGVIPEPSTNALALLGLALVAGSFAMRRKAAAGQA
jgi:hypothetical protein